MSEAIAEKPQAGPGHDDHAHGEYPFLAHHFDTPQHQFDSGKLGIWLFLVTEILFFSGLFCAYAIYRALHPEVFEYAHYYLDTALGAVNTCVLIISSVTAAWAVRNAQLKQQRALVMNIAITILCGFGFMAIKYVEYSHKIHDGLLPGSFYQPAKKAWELPLYQEKFGVSPQAAAGGGRSSGGGWWSGGRDGQWSGDRHSRRRSGSSRTRKEVDGSPRIQCRAQKRTPLLQHLLLHDGAARYSRSRWDRDLDLVADSCAGW